MEHPTWTLLWNSQLFMRDTIFLSSTNREVKNIISKLDNINKNDKKYFNLFLSKAYKQSIIENKLKNIPTNDKQSLKKSAFELITLEEKES